MGKKRTKDKHLKHLSFFFGRLSSRLPSWLLVSTPVRLSPFREAMSSMGEGGHRCSCFFLQLPPFYAFSVLQSGSSADFSPFGGMPVLPWSTSFPSNCGVLCIIYHYFCSFLLCCSLIPSFDASPISFFLVLSIFIQKCHQFGWRTLLCPMVAYAEPSVPAELAASSTGQALTSFHRRRSFPF